MLKPRFALGAIACAVLSACVNQPVAQPQLKIEPLTRVHHSLGSRSAPDSHDERGRHYERTGQIDRALQAYGAAVTADYGNVEARSAMANIYLRKGQVAEAQWLLQEAIVQKPDAAFLHNNLGYVNYLAGDHPAAIKALRTALNLDPSNEWARNNLQAAQEALLGATPRPNHSPSELPQAATPPFEVWGQVVAEQPSTAVDAPAAQEAIVTALASEPVVGTPAAAQEIVPTPSKAFRLEITNSSGIGGLAKRLSESLSRAGMAVVDITSQRPFNRTVTEVQYAEGFDMEARRLADRLGVSTTTKHVAASAVDVRVVLGKDIVARMADIEAKSLAEQSVTAEDSRSSTVVSLPTRAVSLLPAVEVSPFGAKPYGLHIVNANGVRGIAGKAKGFLNGKGVATQWVGDERPYRAVTQIEYRDGYLLEAARLRSTLPNQPVIVKAADLVGTADIKLVLGQDLAGKPELFSASGGQMAASSAEANRGQNGG